MKIKKCLGECPGCGSENLEYNAVQNDYSLSGYKVYPGKCLDCNTKFKEKYAITYSFTEFEEPNND